MLGEQFIWDGRMYSDNLITQMKPDSWSHTQDVRQENVAACLFWVVFWKERLSLRVECVPKKNKQKQTKKKIEKSPLSKFL